MLGCRTPVAAAQGACGGGARRLPSRVLQRIARRALPVLGLWLATCGAGSAQTITAAEYTAPTTRYSHGVLGDDVEWGALRLTLSNGRQLSLTLPESRVFEDIAPRLVDLDGDNAPEVIVVETDRNRGASLAIYDTNGKITATPYIGQSNRWLAPVGAADLDSDGLVELAYVDRPHLAKTLRVWRYADRRLTHVADLPGLTNHKIGWDFIVGGVRDCAAGPEIITADADWRNIMATRSTNTGLKAEAVAAYDGPESVATAMACRK